MKTLQDQRFQEVIDLVDRHGFEYVIQDLAKIADQRVQDYSNHMVITWKNYFQLAAAKLREIKY